MALQLSTLLRFNSKRNLAKTSRQRKIAICKTIIEQKIYFFKRNIINLFKIVRFFLYYQKKITYLRIDNQRHFFQFLYDATTCSFLINVLKYPIDDI